MNRDCDMIRGILIEIEDAIVPKEYKFRRSPQNAEIYKFYYHVKILFDNKYLSGIDASDLSNWCILNVELTWNGHELLNKIRSNTIWEKIKEAAISKGIDLTFDAICNIYPVILNNIF